MTNRGAMLSTTALGVGKTAGDVTSAMLSHRCRSVVWEALLKRASWKTRDEGAEGSRLAYAWSASVCSRLRRRPAGSPRFHVMIS